MAQPDIPIPLSFPAILRNPGITNRFAHLQSASSQESPQHHPTSLKNNGSYEGKRWTRRKDNAHFVGNPHIVAATRQDYSLSPASTRPTFPEPLPPYLSRNNLVPPIHPPIRDPNSANAGRFSMSLKGMRRELRRSGFGVQGLIRDVEHEMVQWLHLGGKIISPDNTNGNEFNFPGVAIGNGGTIFEVSRSPLQLVWSISEDAFARYVVHCCARYYSVVSFSKEVEGRRLTYLLRPNVTRPDFLSINTLDTPPATDVDTGFHLESDSDLYSEKDFRSEGSESDVEVAAPLNLRALSPIDEPNSPSLADVEEWSLVDGPDSDLEERAMASESDLAASVESMTISAADRALALESRSLRQMSIRDKVWSSGRIRSASSPSRSPARRPARRGVVRRSHAPIKDTSQSFFDYLFS